MCQGSYRIDAIIANMRFPLGAGLAMGVGVAALGLFASSEDGYYGDGTTHWEHATKGGGTEVLVPLFAIPTVIAVAFVVVGLQCRSPSALLGIPAFAIYALAILYAYAALAGGH
jgi:hypothetical protein